MKEIDFKKLSFVRYDFAAARVLVAAYDLDSNLVTFGSVTE